MCSIDPRVLTIAVIVGITPLSLQSAEPELPHVRTPIRPGPNARHLRLSWPGAQDREALVVLQVHVDATGKLTRVELDDEGFHDRRFVAASMDIARRMTYLPATLDGVPIDSRTRFPIRYRYRSFGNANGLSRDFRKELKKVETLMEEKDVAGAHFHAQWMLKERARFLDEYTAVHVVQSETSVRAGNLLEALSASRKATARVTPLPEQYQPGGPLPSVTQADFMLDKPALEPLLRRRFLIGVSKGAYVDALRAAADAQALGLIAQDAAMMKDFAKVLDHVQNADALQAEAKLDAEGTWTHDPALRNVAVRDIEHGELRTVASDCGGQLQERPFETGKEMQLPDAMGCSLTFKGQPGTTFTIGEMRR